MVSGRTGVAVDRLRHELAGGPVNGHAGMEYNLGNDRLCFKPEVPTGRNRYQLIDDCNGIETSVV